MDSVRSSSECSTDERGIRELIKRRNIAPFCHVNFIVWMINLAQS